MLSLRRHGDGREHWLLLSADVRSDEGKESLKGLLRAAKGRASTEPLVDGFRVARYAPGVGAGGRR